VAQPAGRLPSGSRSCHQRVLSTDGCEMLCGTGMCLPETLQGDLTGEKGPFVLTTLGPTGVRRSADGRRESLCLQLPGLHHL
jgi:hypothetical protein